MIARYFRLHELGTSVRQEVIGGLTTFVTMAYIIVVNPKILEAAGMPFGASMVATILSAFFGTMLMGVYANRPFAIAPYMGENAFIAYTVVKVLGYSWQTALGAIFIAGVLFTILTVFKIRSWLTDQIPEGLQISFAVGIGLFLTFIGLNDAGIVVLGVPGAPVHVGNLKQPSVLLAVFCFIFIAALMIKKVKGAMLIGILATTFLAVPVGVIDLPKQWISMPPSISPILFKLDIAGALQWGFFSVILTIFVMAFVDTMATLLGVSYKAGMLDERGRLPDIEKPMLCDASATVVASLLGTTTSGAYIESAAGVESGARSGLSSVVTALLFLTALFFAPFFSIIPACAYGAALIIVGLLILTTITKAKLDDLTEAVPIFSVIVLMSFTYNIGIGMTGGFVLYPLMKVLAGRGREVPPGLWVLCGMSLCFFIFYPY
jgi:AGZA family xanthine/uracil permease-like MFS transporter